MQILSNGELAHALLQPIIDRISHYQSIVSVLSAPSLISDVEGFNDLSLVVQNLQTMRENFLTYTDASDHSVYTLQVEVDQSNDIIFNCYTCDTSQSEYTPSIPTEIGRIRLLDGTVIPEGKFIAFSAATKTIEKDMVDMAADSVDMLTVYTIMQTTLSHVITTGKVVGSDIIASIKSKITGVRGVAKTFLEDLTDQISNSSVSGVIECIKQYLDTKTASINSSGYYSFTETYVTKDWFSSVVVSNIDNVIQILGSVVTALSAPIGFALQGIGALVSGVTNFLSDKFNSASVARYQQSEGWQLGLHVLKQRYSYGTQDWNRLFEFINGKGPMHFEFCGFEMHVWCEDPKHATPGITHDDLLLEMFPSCKTFILDSDLQSFLVNHFSASSMAAVTGNDRSIDAEISASYTFKDLTEWYIQHAIAVTDEQWSEWSNNATPGRYASLIQTAAVMLFLLMHAEKPVGTTVADKTFTDYPADHPHADDCSADDVARVVLFPWTINLDNRGQWIPRDPTVPSWTERSGSDDDYVLTQGSQFWTTWLEGVAADSSMSSYGPRMLDFIQRVAVGTQSNPQEFEDHFVAPWSYPVLVRYPFKLLPPQYDRANMISGIILLASLTVIATAVTAIAAYSVISWRQRKQAMIQAKTEQAWYALSDNPTAANVQAYRWACLKQNTIGKIFGCSPVSNKNYWGDTDSGETAMSALTAMSMQPTVDTIDNNMNVVINKVDAVKDVIGGPTVISNNSR